MRTFSCILLAGLLAASAAAPAVAQRSPVGQGSKIISGGFYFMSQKESGDRFTSLSISPGLRYFVLPGLAVGGTISLSAGLSEDADSYGVSVGPGLTYYFRHDRAGAAGGALLPYATFDAMYSAYRYTFDDSRIPDDTRSYYGFDVGPGLLYLLNEHIGLFAQATYVLRGAVDYDETESAIEATGGITVFLP